MSVRRIVLSSAGLVLFLACSSTGGSGTPGATSTTTASSTTSGGGHGGKGGAGGMSDHSSTADGIMIDGGDQGGSTGTAPPPCNHQPNDDIDLDGWTVAEGDCNDCDPTVNPGAVDTPATMKMGDAGATMAIDNNCDGKITTDDTCDGMFVVDDADPKNAARAIELCHDFDLTTRWGLKGAKWVLPDGTPPPPSANYHLGHGILGAFGPNVNVQGGKQMLALSSGTARAPTDPGYQDVQGFSKGYTSGSPAGFPKESPACPGTTTGEPHDGAGLELLIKTPSNVSGFRFQFNFFTFEWPGFVCSTFNDFFVALLSPIPQGQMDGNISFDSMNNPVSVNNALLDVCGCVGGPPCQAGGKNFPCALGDKYLMGTGFGTDTSGQDHGSTYWLQTTAPVPPNSDIQIRFTVYDSGDGVLDTTTLVDHWEWITVPGTTVGTNPVPNPK